MPKSELTKELEYEIWRVTHKPGVFCCYEVTIGWFGDQRVDYLTYDTKGIFRCYEIKVSKSDFHSKSHVTFVGHYNYYVMPQELYDQVKDEIPAHIGVYVGGSCVKKAKKQPLKVDEQVLKDSLIRSLSREVEKHIKSRSPHLIDNLERQISYEKRRADNAWNRYWELCDKLREKFGSRWQEKL